MDFEDDSISFTDPPDSEKLFRFIRQHYKDDFSEDDIRNTVNESVKSLIGSPEIEVANDIEQKLMRLRHTKSLIEGGELFDFLLSQAFIECGDLLSKDRIAQIMRESIHSYSTDNPSGPVLFLADIIARRAYEVFFRALPENERIMIQGLHPVDYLKDNSGEIYLFIKKVQFAYSMRNKVDSFKSANKAADAIYFGCANDIMMSLLAGIETTYMVDPCLDQEFMDYILEDIKKVFPESAYDSGKNELVLTYNDKKYTFKFYKDTLEDFVEEGDHGKADFAYTWRCSADTDIVKKALNEDGIYFEQGRKSDMP